MLRTSALLIKTIAPSKVLLDLRVNIIAPTPFNNAESWDLLASAKKELEQIKYQIVYNVDTNNQTCNMAKSSDNGTMNKNKERILQIAKKSKILNLSQYLRLLASLKNSVLMYTRKPRNDFM